MALIPPVFVCSRTWGRSLGRSIFRDRNKREGRRPLKEKQKQKKKKRKSSFSSFSHQQTRTRTRWHLETDLRLELEAWLRMDKSKWESAGSNSSRCTRRSSRLSVCLHRSRKKWSSFSSALPRPDNSDLRAEKSTRSLRPAGRMTSPSTDVRQGRSAR